MDTGQQDGHDQLGHGECHSPPLIANPIERILIFHLPRDFNEKEKDEEEKTRSTGVEIDDRTFRISSRTSGKIDISFDISFELEVRRSYFLNIFHVSLF